jgi:chromosome partitioning protein
MIQGILMPSANGPICISVINMKGGVGKTTIAALLARHAARNRQLNVLAVDIDPQANLSQALMGEQSYRQFLNDQSPSIVEVFTGYQPPTANSPAASVLNPLNAALVCSPDNLKVIPSRFDFSNNLISAVRPDPQALARLIANNFQDQDLIIIDCTPTESIFTMAAYHASRYILVPVRPEFFATIGFPLLQDSLNTFRNTNRGHQIDVIGVVINNATYDGGNYGGPEKWRSMQEIRSEAAENEWHIFRHELGYSRGFPKLMRGDYSYLGNSEWDFIQFANEFFEMPELIEL